MVSVTQNEACWFIVCVLVSYLTLLVDVYFSTPATFIPCFVQRFVAKNEGAVSKGLACVFVLAGYTGDHSK